MRHVYHLLGDYYDNELLPGGRRHVEAHLQECPSCKAELERLGRLSDLLSEYAMPDTLIAAETFRAQVTLRLSRRVAERPEHTGLVWHFVSLLLLCGLIVLQTLFALSGALAALARYLQWLGVDVGLLLAPFGITWPELGAVPGLFSTSTVAALSAVLMIGLYLGLLTVFVPYVGWVGALWRAAGTGRVRPRT